MTNKTRGAVAGIAIAAALFGAAGAQPAAAQTSREMQCAAAGDALGGLYATFTAKYGANFDNSVLTATEKNQLNRALADVVRAC